VVAVPHIADVIGDACAVGRLRLSEGRICIAGSAGSRMVPRNEVRGRSTVVVIRNQPSIGRRDVPQATVRRYG
jgi:hypothetical protein